MVREAHLRTGDDRRGRTTRGEPKPAGTADKGAALVELAFALPLVIMLIVGMVSAGLAYNHQLSLTHAAREGGRYAATLPVTNFADMEAWLNEIADQVVLDATDTLNPGTPGREICVAYVHPDGADPSDSTARVILDDGGSEFLPDQDCFVDGRPSDERRVQVVASRNVDFNVVFFSTTVILDAQAVSRFEAGMGF